MFTAPLIDNPPRYYRLTRRQWFLFFSNSILAALLIGFFFSSNPVSWSIAVLVILVYIGLAIWMKKNQRQLANTSSEYSLALDESNITVQDHRGQANRTYNLATVDRIILKKEYGIPGESLADLSDELWGSPKRNYLILEREGKQQRLDFVIDSYYGLKQLHKLFDRWQQDGYPIEWR